MPPPKARRPPEVSVGASAGCTGTASRVVAGPGLRLCWHNIYPKAERWMCIVVPLTVVLGLYSYDCLGTIFTGRRNTGSVL